MSRLNWDETGKRRYENGVSNAVLYTPGSSEHRMVIVEPPSSGVSFSPSTVSSITMFNGSENVLMENGQLYILSDEDTYSETKPGYPESLWCTIDSDIYVYKEHIACFSGPNSSPVERSQGKQVIVDYIRSKGISDAIVSGVTFSVRRNALTHKTQVSFIIASQGMSFTRDVMLAVKDLIDSHWLVFVYEDNFEDEAFVFNNVEKRVAPYGQPYYFGHVWNGITSISESPDGAEANDLWADNVKYSSPRSKETYGLTIEAYTYPDEFAVCDGTELPINGVKLGQQKRLPFALAYKTNIGSDSSTGIDNGYLLHLVYNCTASPTDRAYETINDSPDAITFSWEVDSNPVKVDGSEFAPVSSIVIDSTKASSTGLAKLEDILFGTDETVPVMPSPEYVLKCFE